MGITYEPFLTELDRRAEVKGSRDPLGIQSVWVRFGRHVVGNLTTVSTSVRDFTTLILGYYFAEQIANQAEPGSEIEAFLRWEQLAAYSRAQLNNDRSFRGIERVRKALSESSKITISTARQHQILSNQKTYGLWGLYSVPAAASALVEQDPPRLTPPTRQLVEKVYLPVLCKAGASIPKELTTFLTKSEQRLEVSESNKFASAVAHVLSRRLLAQEVEFYRAHLVDGGPQDTTNGRQAVLASLIRHEPISTQPLSPSLLRELARMAALKGQIGQSVARDLDRIRACESVVAPAAALYVHMLGLDGKTSSSLAQRVRETWGATVKSVQVKQVESLREELAGDDPETGVRWVSIAQAMGQGDYEETIRLLIEQNRSVMTARGGAAWIEFQDGKFLVRFRDEMGFLPPKDILANYWRHPYFIDSLRSVTRQLGGR